ncbi:hypothetical protein J2T10_000086 [Paenarthrobacter nicotinovorans]|uniref:Uncharacterized protein n=1 Tax=Paenarthrobacter nicotinovorans TaxID=29320 RepID=A0ABT9TIZ1_PAENI|nr:hypothetical protein [Paenarthrobacter nicotinovorans]
MCDREECWMSDDECTADYFDGNPPQQEPCEYCSRWNENTQECDGTCEAITQEMWIARFGDAA